MWAFRDLVSFPFNPKPSMESIMDDTKPWYMSRTVWGSLVAIAASIGGAFGIMIAEVDQIEITDTIL